MTGFHFSKVHVFKIREGMVVDERETHPLKLLIPSTASIPTSTVPPMVGVVGGESSFVPSVASVELSEGVKHQAKGKRIDEEENVTPKRTLEDEGDTAGSASFKKGLMAPPQETEGSIPTLPSTVQIPILDSSDWTECINIGSCQDELHPAILEKFLYPSAMATASVHKEQL
ncbi:hypothetical protein Fot_11414 [Forsythia ovata]|uniref:Uncharacterized protein n=1 Tax=Forsythia ovata TaxID=205694 RepID=A0ABD1WJL4_9LAMI